MAGLKALGTICASLMAALAMSALACLLPDDPYERWQLSEGKVYDLLRWGYERMHFDDRPIDVIVVGPSKTLFGVSAARVQQGLAARGEAENVVNLSVPGEGRNLHWAVVDEIFRSKSPKVVVVGVSEPRAEFGHPGFKDIATAQAIAFPPAALLHNYFRDLATVPARQVKLFFAGFFPGLAGLRDKFDPALYVATKSDFTSGTFVIDNKIIDMEAEVPAETLAAQSKKFRQTSTLAARLLTRCCNEGDDHVYIREIAKLAKAHGARLIFVYMPNYGSTAVLSDRNFLSQYGLIIDNSDLAQNSKLFYNFAHLNHAGAMIASDRIVSAITAIRTSSTEGAN